MSSLTNERRLTYTVARQQLAKLLRACNIEGVNYGWHSLRSGAASEALRRGAPACLVQAHGRWATREWMAPYRMKLRTEKIRVDVVEYAS